MPISISIDAHLIVYPLERHGKAFGSVARRTRRHVEGQKKRRSSWIVSWRWAPDVADMSAAAFRSLARPLIRTLEDCGDEAGLGTRLVPTRELVSPESLIARTSINRMAGFTTMPPRDIASFLPQDGFEPPEGPFYLVIEPHTGTCYINREPDVARKLIDSDERLPLTLEEGLAIATQHPEWLLEKNGFNLLGSRSADGRVPSIWMSQNAPRLGAVWPNSRHTWLGNAYCMARRGVSLFR